VLAGLEEASGEIGIRTFVIGHFEASSDCMWWFVF
jgi:hypothetical protein